METAIVENIVVAAEQPPVVALTPKEENEKTPSSASAGADGAVTVVAAEVVSVVPESVVVVPPPVMEVDLEVGSDGPCKCGCQPDQPLAPTILAEDVPTEPKPNEESDVKDKKKKKKAVPKLSASRVESPSSKTKSPEDIDALLGLIAEIKRKRGCSHKRGPVPVKSASATANSGNASEAEAASTTATTTTTILPPIIGRQISPKHKRVTRKALEQLVSTRTKQGMSHHRNLFLENGRELINQSGDIRFLDCTLKVPIGPFQTGQVVSTIDWLSSADLLMLNNTNKISETVVVPLSAASLETVIPMEVASLT